MITIIIVIVITMVRSEAIGPAWGELKNHCEEAAANVAHPPVQEKRSVRPRPLGAPKAHIVLNYTALQHIML